MQETRLVGIAAGTPSAVLGSEFICLAGMEGSNITGTESTLVVSVVYPV